MRRLSILAVAVAATLTLATAIAPAASAHEQRTVAGKYAFVVGFIVEPAIIEEPNGIDLRITDTQTNQPVEGVEKSLKAEMVVGPDKKTVDLKARFRQPGAYTADIIPTKTGTWSFRFFGTIDGTAINERFESGPGRFNDVQAKTDLQFPAKQPTIGELAQQVQQAPRAGQAAEAAAQPSPDVQRTLDELQQARSTATTIGIIGIITGVAGIALAALALLSRRQGGRPTEPV
ncbi:MAG: hypothetical protein U0531_09280 [Dehalococcoidia bacterium]